VSLTRASRVHKVKASLNFYFSDKSSQKTPQKARKDAGTADLTQERDLDDSSWLHVWRLPSETSSVVSDQPPCLPPFLLPFSLLVPLMYKRPLTVTFHRDINHK
jgi:hypothetical protein